VVPVVLQHVQRKVLGFTILGEFPPKPMNDLASLPMQSFRVELLNLIPASIPKEYDFGVS